MVSGLGILVAAESFVMGLACACGLIANVAVAIMAGYSTHLRHTKIYVVNRAVTDALFLLTVPLDVTAHLMDSWVLSTVMCKIRCAFAFASLLASSFFLVGMTLEVYVALCHPQASARFHSTMAKVVCVVSWFAFLVFLLPLLIQSEVLQEVGRHRHHCVSLPLSLANTFGRVLRFFAVGAVFVVPAITCWVFVRLTAAFKCQYYVGGPVTHDDQKKRGLWHPRNLQVCLVSVFTVCHLPYWLPQLLKEALPEEVFTEAAMTVFPVTMCLPAVNAAVTPLLCLLSIREMKRKMMSEKADDGNTENNVYHLQAF